MNVNQVKQKTSEWLATNLAHYPGLCGAHFVGSINTMPDDAYFPPYKDVDFHLIFREGSPALENHGPFMNILETEFNGMILEGGYKPFTDYQTPEAVLSNPEVAHHLTVNSLIYDPEGWLQGLQKPTRQEYARRKWVMSRIDFERKALEQWQEIRPHAQLMDSSGLMEISLLGYHMTFLVALLCVATLQSPSSAYNRMRDILAEYDRLDLFNEAMDILGLRNFTTEQAKKLLEEGAEAFDLAVKVRRTPFPFQHKLNPHQRGYFVDACQSLIENGWLEEAVGKTLAFYVASINVILADGPEEVGPRYRSQRGRLLEMIDMSTPKARDEKFARVLWLDEQFFKLADMMVKSNPTVFD